MLVTFPDLKVWSKIELPINNHNKSMKKLIIIGCSSMYTLKWDLKMKLTVFFLLVCMLQINATTYSQKTRISLDMNDVHLSEVLNRIETISEFKFFVDTQKIDVKREVGIKANKEKIFDILDKLFSGTNITYEVYKKQILLKKVEVKSTKSTSVGPGQSYMEIIKLQQTIKGTITDKNGTPLAGANILEKGTTNGTQADFDGNFSISVKDDNAVLVISYIGFTTKEVTLGQQTSVNVQLEESAQGLEEVVLVGYGTQKKASISGSVATLEPEELVETPVTNLSNAIAGLLPGVIVNSGGGDPGADDAQILIRGKGTLGNTSALIIIDGIPDRGGFSRLNPKDIESFSVLKDASAAIYGARAANGVILITTKRGKLGKPTFSVSSNISLSQPVIKLNPLDSWQEATLANESKLPGEPDRWSPEQIELLRNQSQPLQYPNTDWEELLLKDWSQITNYTASVRGGNEDVRYFLSGQYLKQDGVYKGYDYPFEQYSLRANIDAQLTKSFSLGVDLLYRKEERNYGGKGTFTFNYVNNGGRYLVGYFPDGRVGKGFQPGEYNAAESVSPNGGFTDDNKDILNTKVSFNWDMPLKGLSLSAYGAFDSNSSSYKSFKNIWDEWLYSYDTDTYSKAVDATERSLTESKSDWFTQTYNIKLGYNESFDKHNFDAFVAYEQSQFKTSTISASRTGLPSDLLVELFTGSSKGQNNNGYSAANGRVNYFGRINYDYDSKYFATFSLRHDGSQNFAPDKRFGTFPAISAGWRLSKESFLEDNKIVSNLKLRGSIGKMGNDNVGAFQYLTTYAFTNYDAYGWGVLEGYDYGNGTESGIFEAVVANPNITWETATTANIGLEGGLFNNRLNFEFDYFTSKRENILIARNASVPEYTGLVLPDENLGRVDNKGFEFSLSHQNAINEDFSYNLGGNISYARNKVVFFDEPEGVKNYQKYEGKPIDSYLMFEGLGIYQTQEEIDASAIAEDGYTNPGDIQIKDQNGDNIIDNDDRIRIDQGNIPEIVYGINMGLTYKNFELSMLFQGQANAYVSLNNPLDQDKLYFENRFNNGNSIYPRVNSSTPGGYGSNSTFWLRKADFLRFKNVNLTYNFPQQLLDNIKVSGLQLFLRGNNLFLLYDDIEGNWRDPEDNTGTFPIQRSWQFGVNLTF